MSASTYGRMPLEKSDIMRKDNKWMDEIDSDEIDDKEPFITYLTPLIVFLVSMGCFVFFFCKAACYIHDDMQSLKQVVIFETDPFANDYSQFEENTESGWADTDADVIDSSQQPDIAVYDYETLMEQIPATAYISIPGTNISYPVMWSEEEGYFLYRDSQGRDNRNGSIFLSDENNPDLSDPINYIFGHNMKSGHMFGQLNRFLDEDYLAKHNICYIVTEEATKIYILYYAETVPDTTLLPRFNNAYLGTEEYNAYLQALSQRTGISFTRDAQLIEIITCSKNQGNRTIVYGYLCDDGLSDERDVGNRK